MSVNLLEPLTIAIEGTPLPLRYFAVAELPGVPSWPKMNDTSSLSTSLRACSTAFGGL